VAFETCPGKFYLLGRAGGSPAARSIWLENVSGGSQLSVIVLPLLVLESIYFYKSDREMLLNHTMQVVILELAMCKHSSLISGL
jgi:hypothetical protein